MLRSLICLMGGILLLGSGCSKNNNSPESALYGTWVKGVAAGDTLWFMNKGGRNILRANMSFNPGLANYTEMEYSYVNNKLQVDMYGGGLKDLDSFSWKEQNKSFELLGYQLYMFMSSTLTKFTFTKL
ncbi:MAG: hypothetical protein QM751_13890 [Paludibacteraceae bacterium]